MPITRRAFLKSGGVAMIGWSALPSFLARAVAATPAAKNKILVVLFQRGAADGLNIVAPFAEREYYRLRPSIAIPQPARSNGDASETALDLDGFFGLHPSLAPLRPLYQEKRLAIVHAAGSPDSTRSHFDAQDYMESGTPGVKRTENGWLNRSLQTQPDERATPFRAVSMGPNLPRILQGSAPALAIPDLRQFQVVETSPLAEGSFEAIYAQTVDQALGGAGRETFRAIEMLRRTNPAGYAPAKGAVYPRNRFGQNLLQVAQLIKANVGLEVAFLDSGGWDHHVNEGGPRGQLANLLRDWGAGLAAFARDMEDRMEDIVVVTMSEFGRAAHENGNGGTDHGHANCLFVFGGPVAGGKVYGRWPGLAREQLYEGRDLALTTDFRTVLGEILARHLGNQDLHDVFPTFENDPKKFLGLLRA